MYTAPTSSFSKKGAVRVFTYFELYKAIKRTSIFSLTDYIQYTKASLHIGKYELQTLVEYALS
jgi:hypothetical protein